MVYLEDWSEFLAAAEELYRAAPLKTRYATKYRHRDGALVLKVTDDVRCLKFKTEQAQDVKKVEKLNALMLSLMARGLDSSPEDLLAPPQQPATSQKGGGGRGGAGAAQGGGAAQQPAQSRGKGRKG